MSWKPCRQGRKRTQKVRLPMAATAEEGCRKPCGKALAGVAQAGGDACDAHQQRLFQRAFSRVLLVPRASQQLDLHEVQWVEIGVTPAERLKGFRAEIEQFRLFGQPQHYGQGLRQSVT